MENSRENMRESGKGHNPLGVFLIVMMGPAMGGNGPRMVFSVRPVSGLWPWH